MLVKLSYLIDREINKETRVIDRSTMKFTAFPQK